MSKGYRVYREGFPHHVFTRSKNGGILFYSTSDCLFYTTLYCCLARRHKICTRAFSIMPNHIHSNEQSPDKKTFLHFHRQLNSDFSREYNRAHGRTGPLFDAEFGYAAKTAGKKIRDNICYIANNACVGKMAKDVLDYRWNLLAYRQTDHPFSEKIVLRHSSRPFQRAVRMVNYYRKYDHPMSYARQKVVFKGLTLSERQQIIDYILSKYNCMDYVSMEGFYGNSFDKACLSWRTNSGSEHDIPEDYEDYGIYARMLRLAAAEKVDLIHCNFETAAPELIRKLERTFRRNNFPERQIRRFLHQDDSSDNSKVHP